MWASLHGAQRAVSVGTDRARRFAPGFSPILGFIVPDEPELADIAPFCQPDEQLYCAEWSGPAPHGWTIHAEATMYQMMWTGGAPERAGDDAIVRLGRRHAGEAMELAALTRPGPFGPRTLELGEYWGFFADGRLVAMAGERLHLPPFREISGVCTHPTYQGRGFAGRLMVSLIGRELRRGEVPFLHVMRDNTGAWGFYERLGFVRRREVPVRVISRCA